VVAGSDRWLPRRYSFKPICLRGNDKNVRVAELINEELSYWKEEMVREIFLPCDADLILRMPLCQSWPNNKLIWHYTVNGEFTVKSAYSVARLMGIRHKRLRLEMVIILCGSPFGSLMCRHESNCLARKCVPMP